MHGRTRHDACSLVPRVEHRPARGLALDEANEHFSQRQRAFRSLKEADCLDLLGGRGGVAEKLMRSWGKELASPREGVR